MPIAPDAAALELCPIFKNMSADERKDVLDLVECYTYPKGEMVLREGRSIQLLWVILQGQCEVVKARKGGGEQQLATLEPMAIFGEMSFFNPAPHSASVRTLTDVEVIRLSRECFDQLQVSSSTAAHKLAVNTLNVLGDRLRRMDDWMCDLVEKPEGAKHLQEWHEFRSRLYSDWQF